MSRCLLSPVPGCLATCLLSLTTQTFSVSSVSHAWQNMPPEAISSEMDRKVSACSVEKKIDQLISPENLLPTCTKMCLLIGVREREWVLRYSACRIMQSGPKFCLWLWDLSVRACADMRLCMPAPDCSVHGWIQWREQDSVVCSLEYTSRMALLYLNTISRGTVTSCRGRYTPTALRDVLCGFRLSREMQISECLVRIIRHNLC